MTLCFLYLLRYKGILFGDISAVCGFLRVPYLQRLLQATVSYTSLSWLQYGYIQCIEIVTFIF